jgi:hypothetical protein
MSYIIGKDRDQMTFGTLSVRLGARSSEIYRSLCREDRSFAIGFCTIV